MGKRQRGREQGAEEKVANFLFSPFPSSPCSFSPLPTPYSLLP